MVGGIPELLVVFSNTASCMCVHLPILELGPRAIEWLVQFSEVLTYPGIYFSFCQCFNVDSPSIPRLQLFLPLIIPKSDTDVP